ncbi:shikimate dehydrogenase [Pseudalkalibacillus sp. SCS-8]|uniref:shikimate dehydrogenase n=1 Tax=Pseudalkalibacillus nanhaiensis TaxID=3115291 RepID=UPI0032DB03D9
MHSFKGNRPYYAVIGDPIAHSMSPEIHNACLEHHHMDAVYEAIRVRSDELPNMIEELRETGCKGFNVTIPHKVKIMEHLDEIDPLANEIGAVNTVVIENGRLKGYNTDGLGFFKGLRAFYKRDLKATSILILGAGGASRAIVKTLIKQGVRNVTIANRTVEKAHGLLNGSRYGQAITISAAEHNLESFDIIINTTPIGMYPNTDEIPLSIRTIDSGTALIDIIYNPLMTEFLKQGRRIGCTVQNGVPMFVHQAALAFELWTGQEPDSKIMEDIVIKKLGGKK